CPNPPQSSQKDRPAGGAPRPVRGGAGLSVSARLTQAQQSQRGLRRRRAQAVLTLAAAQLASQAPPAPGELGRPVGVGARRPSGPSLALRCRLQQLDEENSELRSCTPCLKASIQRLEEEKQKLLDEIEELSERLGEEQATRRRLGDRLSQERHQFQRDKEATQELIEDLRRQLEHLQLFKLEAEQRRGRSSSLGLQEYQSRAREGELELEVRRLKQLPPALRVNLGGGLGRPPCPTLLQPQAAPRSGLGPALAVARAVGAGSGPCKPALDSPPCLGFLEAPADRPSGP
ncbi:PREDICTED: rab11 family-interacting protein 3, partial [Condylura cristata]|uniref:rab11 family-interacting protein 3 n=1 Tax=Condylura cristata TaxID=143302 RepID=UPI000642C0E9